MPANVKRKGRSPPDHAAEEAWGEGEPGELLCKVYLQNKSLRQRMGYSDYANKAMLGI